MSTRRLLPLPLLLLGLSLAAAGTAGRAGRARSRLQDGDDALGSPGELTWQAWLRMARPPADAHSHADDEEVGAPRRIASRSIFVVQGATTRRPPAPCGDGFRANTVGGCHLVINVGVALAPAPAPAPAQPSDEPSPDLPLSEGSGAPPEDLALPAHFGAFKMPSGRAVSARSDRKSVYSVLKENAEASDYKRKSKLLRMLPTSSEQYRHMLPIIGGEEHQEIPFSEVRVRGID